MVLTVMKIFIYARTTAYSISKIWNYESKGYVRVVFCQFC